MNTRHTVVLCKHILERLPVGLAMSQVVHCSDAFERELLLDKREASLEQRDWLTAPYITILAVFCTEDLNLITKRAEDEGLPVKIWEDTIPSPTLEGQAIKAVIGISIGPADFDKIKIVTNGLPLY